MKKKQSNNNKKKKPSNSSSNTAIMEQETTIQFLSKASFSENPSGTPPPTQNSNLKENIQKHSKMKKETIKQ